jgi:hypothetical protein
MPEPKDLTIRYRGTSRQRGGVESNRFGVVGVAAVPSSTTDATFAFQLSPGLLPAARSVCLPEMTRARLRDLADVCESVESCRR